MVPDQSIRNQGWCMEGTPFVLPADACSSSENILSWIVTQNFNPSKTILWMVSSYAFTFHSISSSVHVGGRERKGGVIDQWDKISHHIIVLLPVCCSKKPHAYQGWCPLVTVLHTKFGTQQLDWLVINISSIHEPINLSKWWWFPHIRVINVSAWSKESTHFVGSRFVIWFHITWHSSVYTFLLVQSWNSTHPTLIWSLLPNCDLIMSTLAWILMVKLC